MKDQVLVVKIDPYATHSQRVFDATALNGFWQPLLAFL